MSKGFNTTRFFKDMLYDKYVQVLGNAIVLDNKIEPTDIVHRYINMIENRHDKKQIIVTYLFN